MKTLIPACVAAMLLCAPFPVTGQETSGPAYVYVTYFLCDAGREFRADEIIERSFKPHYDSAVEAGEILQWSWLSHFVGGQWRRALVIGAGNMDDLLAAAGALGEAIQDSTPEAGRVFTEVCPEHEDYIWRTIPGIGGNAVGTERGSAGFSTYWNCDVNQEDRVDELVRETLGPVYDARIANGDLVSWTWLAHDVGGEWRRMLSMTATDHNAMMRTRDAIIAEMQSGRTGRALSQMNEICPDHEDLMWDIRYETP
jgi:hypothetical protein